jgi:hypothetical protein
MLLHKNPCSRPVCEECQSEERNQDERKVVFDALRDELRERDYLPILFDFDKPASRNPDETITLLARMARFVIADISDAKSGLAGTTRDRP